MNVLGKRMLKVVSVLSLCLFLYVNGEPNFPDSAGKGIGSRNHQELYLNKI